MIKNFLLDFKDLNRTQKVLTIIVGIFLIAWLFGSIDLFETGSEKRWRERKQLAAAEERAAAHPDYQINDINYIKNGPRPVFPKATFEEWTTFGNYDGKTFRAGTKNTVKRRLATKSDFGTAEWKIVHFLGMGTKEDRSNYYFTLALASQLETLGYNNILDVFVFSTSHTPMNSLMVKDLGITIAMTHQPSKWKLLELWENGDETIRKLVSESSFKLKVFRPYGSPKKLDRIFKSLLPELTKLAQHPNNKYHPNYSGVTIILDSDNRIKSVFSHVESIDGVKMHDLIKRPVASYNQTSFSKQLCKEIDKPVPNCIENEFISKNIDIPSYRQHKYADIYDTQIDVLGFVMNLNMAKEFGASMKEFKAFTDGVLEYQESQGVDTSAARAFQGAMGSTLRKVESDKPNE